MFPNLSLPLNITLTVLIAIAAIWTLFLITDLIFVMFFKTVLKKHAKGMTVILNAKYENTKKLYEIFKNYKVPVDRKLIDTLEKIDPKTFGDQSTKECELARTALSYLRDEASFISNKNRELLEKPDFMIAKNNVLELDTQYRSNVAMYNADVLGYNYWISFLPCRFIFKMFKVKKKELIAQHIACAVIFL